MKLRERLIPYRILLLWILATAVVWGFLQTYDSTVDGIPKKYDPVDLLTIGFAALGATALVLVTLKGTHHWTIRGVGLLAVFLGDSILWWSVEVSRIDTTRTLEPVNDLIRAIFLTGLPLVLIGVAGYIDESRPVEKSDQERFKAQEDSGRRRGKRQNRREVRQDHRELKLDKREDIVEARQNNADTRQANADTRQALQDAYEDEKGNR